MPSSTFPIYTGRWVDRSHSYLQGATLTLTTRDGAFLVPFLTLFITIAGGFFWNIVAYAYHQARVNGTRDDQNAFWNQEQVILRNTGSPLKVAIELIRGYWAWRKVEKRCLRHALTGIALALSTLAVFSGAGILAGQVTKSASNNVLIKSTNCGYWQIPTTSQSSSAKWESLVLQSTLANSQYARSCYGDLSDGLACGVYTNETIYYAVNANATCPFASGLCLYSDTAAYEMDTGHMDSNDALGLNGPKNARITYRKVTTCAPIHTGDYIHADNLTTGAGRFIDPVIYLYMGPYVQNGMDLIEYTYMYNIHGLVESTGYQLTSVIANPVENSGWVPTPDLNRTDADVSLMILAQNSISYDVPSDDPFFSAHLERNLSSGDLSEIYYVGDDYFNSLACTDQHQFCNPTLENLGGDCTHLTDGTTIIDELAKIGLSDLQLATASRIEVALPFNNMYYSVNGRGASALRASETCFGNDQLPLAYNQWQIEVEAWFTTSLARLQQSMVDYATGPSNIPSGVDVIHPSSTANLEVCKSQKIKITAGYQNFSMVGIVIILGVGLVIIIVGLTLDLVVGTCQRQFRPNAPGPLAWVLDEKRQLQRMAFEGAQWTGWQNCNDGIPITAEGALLGRYGPLCSQHPGIVRRAGDRELSADHEGEEMDQLLSRSRDREEQQRQVQPEVPETRQGVPPRRPVP